MAIIFTISFSREAVDAFKESAGALEGSQPTSSSVLMPPRVQLEVHYQEELKIGDDSKELIARTERIEIIGEGKVDVALESVAGGLTVDILNGDGSESSSHQVQVAHGKAEYTITARDVKQLLAGSTVPPTDVKELVTRYAQLVPIGRVKPDFVKSRLSVALVNETEIKEGGGLAAFGFMKDRMTTVEVLESLVTGLSAMSWRPTHIGVDGQFAPLFQKRENTVGWVWWLSGERQIVGFVNDELSKPSREPRVIALPVLQPLTIADSYRDDTCADRGKGVSADVTEMEVVNNPGIYTEDPGAFCKPFSNPERVLSEKSFAVVARIQQPDISAMGSTRTRSQHLLDLDPTPVTAVAGTSAVAASHGMVAPPRDVLVNTFLISRAPKRYKEPPEQVEEKKQMPSGRTLMSAEHPLQWEDDIAQYQAATVALGHILEFRVRTRSNGYSLGNVASTLTLAPRQTKRIQKITFERLERARRQERTQIDDRVNDETTRERDYNDTVSAYLSEWATGSSSSGTSAASGGIGFAIPPIVGGVGGGASKAWSKSETEGARSLTASEQQRLRDSIRRHGDALRRFESTVVTEVSQEETVTGSTEIVRNPNYGHSLTVIYYQILRHLKVSTEFAGARECLFVPFAIKPFTLQRVYRWREAIQKYIRVSRFGKAMKHLRDVLTKFQFSNLQSGARADQQLTYLRGSVFITLAIGRPSDRDDGKYDEDKWQAISPFLGSPSYGIWAALAAKAAALRDQLFQKDYAPTIASKWANKLVIKEGANKNLQADCTLATRYGFNQTVRVDFAVPTKNVSNLTRRQLSTMFVVAGAPLPPGSVANVSRMSLRYGTASFDRTIEGLSGVDDVVEPGSGIVNNGAQLDFPTDDWDEVDEQEQLRHSVNELIEHLNEHVEFYHKAIWWSMDRDRLLMMLDGFYVPSTNKISIASVVDREPLAIIGNSLVYRVGAASYIGYDKVNSPTALYNLYAEKEPIADPILISLPTDGLYAQTIMDECLALEEHQGSVDWVLNDPDPELGTIDPSLMTSRRADVSSVLAPTNMPGTIINLQNAPDAPAPTGLQGVLNAVTNPNSFRDMAGLAGTQSNAMAALNTAASLATNFGSQAAALKMADMASRVQSTEKVNQQLAAVQKAKGQGLISDDDAAQHTNKILGQMHTPGSEPITPMTQEPDIQEAIRSGNEFTATRSDAKGSQVVVVRPPVFAGYSSTSDDQKAKDESIVNSIAKELALTFTDPDDPGLYERRQRLKKLFESVSNAAAKSLYDRLGENPTGDSLSKEFHGRLATSTRRELLWLLRVKIDGAVQNPVSAAPPPVLLPVTADAPLPPSEQQRFDKALFQLRIKVQANTSISAPTRRTLECWFEKLQKPGVDDRIIQWSRICPSTSGAIGAAAIVGPCDYSIGMRPSQEEIENAFASASDVELNGKDVGIITYIKTAIVIAEEMTSMQVENILKDKVETFDAVNKLDAWANSPMGGSSAMPPAYRAIKDWLALRQNDNNSLYSCP